MDVTAARMGDVGAAYIGAIERRDFDALEALLAPDVRFRALTPRREPTASTAPDARAIVEGWFAESDSIEEVGRSVDEVVDRFHLAYRLRLREEGVWKLVEQQMFATIAGGRIVDISLVCSGFRPVGEAGIEPVARLEAVGEDCATLTPKIRDAICELRSGEVLEVIADDPAAEDGLRAWSRLTGNQLVGVDSPAAGEGAPHFYLRRR